MKKVNMKVLFISLFMFIVVAASCFAWAPDSGQWQWVASDNQNSQLYVRKDPIGYEVPGKDGSFVIYMMSMAIRSDGMGSVYKDVVSHTPTYGNLIRHQAIWSFRGNPSHPLTANWTVPSTRKWYDANGHDPWYVAEFNYAVLRADALGFKYKR